MNNEFKAYSKIGQYRNAVKDMIYFFTEAGVEQLHFQGTVKLHGTNAGIHYCCVTDELTCQSRTRIITPDDDNCGFSAWVDSMREDLLSDFQCVGNGEDVSVYGEWCGKGIQKGVAISEVQKQFVIFRVEIGGVQIPLLQIEQDDFQTVNLITMFKHWHRTITLDTIESMSNEFARITDEVEQECPVAKIFGVSGVGEGVVWNCLNTPNDATLMFKVKGQKHSISKVKTLAPVDPEKLKSISEFVEYAVTENRLNQGISEIGLDQSLIGQFIGWINKDIHSEEQDVLQKSDLTMKNVGKKTATKARAFYMRQLEQEAFSKAG